jgi:competence protein CoiA
MKFANIECQRREAQRGLSATCPSCGAEVIAKCGDHRVWHWAHRGVRVCDPWWEPETEWHRAWKNEFPADWQEAIQFAQTSEKHVADVKTQSGMVIEFQHSFLKTEERMSREAFYRKMVWVVDGRRRKRDAAQLFKCIGPCVSDHPPFILYVAHHEEECALLRDWNSSPVPVYFDLGTKEDGTHVFWRRDPISRNGRVYLTPVSRESFLQVHREGRPDTEEKFSEGVGVIVEALRRAAQRPQPLPTPGFPRYRARRRL